MYGEKCSKEGCDEPGVTDDHVIPVWLIKRLPLFELEGLPPVKNNRRPMCAKHNGEKGSRINYRDQKVRRFMLAFVAEILSKIKTSKTT